MVDLDANNVKARLPHGGSLWWDGNDGKYIFPKESEVAAIFAGGLWIAGTDPAGNLKLSATTYGLAFGSNAYWPGPIDPITVSTNANTCANWDIHFRATDEAINSHKADFADNGQIDNPIPFDLAGWPAKGNPLFFQTQGFELPNNISLAPFWDENGDGIYNPNDGDYPDIKDASTAIWWIFNTIGNINSTNSDVAPMEIQAMAYAYNSTTPAINNTTYYDLKLIHRGVESLENTYVSLWIDGDLGCYEDDYVGCMPENDLVFIYNEDAIDGNPNCFCPQGVNTYCEEIPVVGIKLVKGPVCPKVFGDNGELLIPESGMSPDTVVQLGMSSFMVIQNNAIGIPPPNMTDPSSSPEYYNYMQGLWRDGSQPMTFNGEPSSFIYSGNPGLPVDGDWSMCSQNFGNGDRRMLMNVGPFRMKPGAVNQLTFAVTGVENVMHPCPDITPLIEATNQVEDLFDSIITSTKVVSNKSNVISFSPNPMIHEGRFVLEDSNDKIQSIKIFSINGQEIKSIENINESQFTYTNSSLISGMYIYRVFTENGKQYAGKFVK